jgi:hypothetical protein
MGMTKVLLAVVAVAAAASVSAAPVQWANGSGGNDHWYEYVLLPTGGGFTWDGAAADAATHTHMGMNGYMATVTSLAEQSFIFGNVTASTAWLGGNDRAVEGDWTWVAGPEAGTVFYIAGAATQPGFSFWNAGEPNNCCSGEDDLQINWNGTTGEWNDHGTPSFPNDTWGYIIEFGAPRQGVPEPGSLLLAGIGLAGLSALRRKRAPTM